MSEGQEISAEMAEHPLDDEGVLVPPVVVNAGVSSAATAGGVLFPENAWNDDKDKEDTNTIDAHAPPPTKKRDRRVGSKGVVATTKEMIELNEDNADPSSGQGSSAGLATVVHQTKHDEKWNTMFASLLEYKETHKSTLVPQCYDTNPRLGRWVHYQRVEYWMYQSSRKGKITPERIQRLEEIGFEWDPQRAQWNAMFARLKEYHVEHGHCKVPKSYIKEPELANWVRNQRLEYAYLIRKKKTRMTQDRLDLLSEIGFTWSNPLPDRSSAGNKKRKPEQLQEHAEVVVVANKRSKENVSCADAAEPSVVGKKATQPRFVL